MRWVAAVLLVVGLLVGGPATAHARTGCPGQEAPPAPPSAEELAGPAAAALPVPAEPVGGLGVCGDAVAGGGAVPAEVGVAGFVLADLDTGAVLAARAPHARHRPASAIKVLTAIVALRELDPDLVVDGTAEDLRIDGSRAGIGPGGRYTVRQLLAGMLLNSGNDTAAALARAMGGDAATVAAMTATAGALGALDTRPATPSGLDGPGGASSAYDLALLFRVAMREPLFAGTVATLSVPFPGYGDVPGFELSNSSRFLGRYPGALGGKAGFTDAARHTFVGAAERDGRRLVVALVRGEQSPVPMTAQVAALLDLGFALPAGVAPVGTLVAAAPAVPVVTPPAPPAAVAPEPGRPAPDDPAPAGPLVLVGVAVLVALAAGAALVRRRS
ncbi:D-alanyl-D-alanine carboxypeptidase family protein [Pseudonocardia broussonetiae]|uniref:D-alanyl-D-alanine carboxypeptidase n=1 Tax=Pseudonocardia broussonetiae TaxID=2736640 RepID=A0A6M6JIR6_9PSEU|nr:serine hydrolase [Pseudonocardia broussonetiae]QJY46582.1 D-alanyl-D-alanine carboxypeptidase [Pseudonocardia broussonetiae]